MFYLIDKPIGITSFDVIRKLRKVLGTKKIWHTGTLDPLATWLLLIATEKSTKLIPEIDTAKKRYTFTVALDGKSASLDLWTPVDNIDTSSFTERTTRELISYLVSLEEQTPPKYSALHIDGRRAYDLAREGKEFDLKPRKIHIEDVEIHTYIPKKSITISLTISSGGYIRSLAPLIWGFFGLDGGYISSLRRIAIMTPSVLLREKDSISLDEKDLFPLSYDILFPDTPMISIDDTALLMIQQGKSLELPWYENGKKYFLKHASGYMSWCYYTDGVFTIIRNDV